MAESDGPLGVRSAFFLLLLTPPVSELLALRLRFLRKLIRDGRNGRGGLTRRFHRELDEFGLIERRHLGWIGVLHAHGMRGPAKGVDDRTTRSLDESAHVRLREPLNASDKDLHPPQRLRRRLGWLPRDVWLGREPSSGLVRADDPFQSDHGDAARHRHDDLQGTLRQRAVIVDDEVAHIFPEGRLRKDEWQV